MIKEITKLIPEKTLMTFAIRYLAFTKIPLAFYVRPSVTDISNTGVKIKIPFKRRNKNHIGSMYFGAMTIGAEVAAGIIAMNLIRESKQKISLIFKHFTGDFLKRAEGDTFFICEDGESIGNLVRATIESGEREEIEVAVRATVPSKLGNEPIARFSFTLSLKMRG